MAKKKAEAKPKETAAKKTTAKKKTEKAEKVDLSAKIESFKAKVSRSIRVSNVEPFAKEFFGDDFKSSKVKDFTVTILLSNGDKIEVNAI